MIALFDNGCCTTAYTVIVFNIPAKYFIPSRINHRYCKPYCLQTNGKVERFCKTPQEDLIKETDLDSLEELKDELIQYLYYYNHQRPHQAIDGKTPADMRTKDNNSADALSTNGET